MQLQFLSNGINAVMEFCTDNRMSDTAKKYQIACTTISKIYEEHGTKYYEQCLNEEIRQKVKIRLHGCPIASFSDDRYLLRTIGMLDDFFAEEPFKEKYPIQSRYKHTLNPFYEEWAENFKASLSVSTLTIPVLYSLARDFFFYLQEARIVEFSDINQDTIYDFLKYEYSDHKGCIGNVLYVTRLLCVFLKRKGYQDVPMELLPFAFPPSRKKVLPAFKYSDMESILKTPNTEDAVGKRDYAILMLASVTGMRAIDIANLKLTDINWNDQTIHFVQHKTGFGLSLPLDAEAAFAVADYILHGRPDANFPFVFLTGVMPYRKLNDKSSVANVLNKYARLSGIEKTAYDGKAFHAFRRSMGAWMLNSSASPEMISQVLGHHSKDVLKRYLPLDTASLSICAVGFEDIPVKSEVYR